MCILSTVATDALVLKHQDISILSADQIFIALDKLQNLMGCLSVHRLFMQLLKKNTFQNYFILGRTV